MQSGRSLQYRTFSWQVPGGSLNSAEVSRLWTPIIASGRVSPQTWHVQVIASGFMVLSQWKLI